MELKLKEEKSVIMLHVSISCDGVHMCTKYTGREERGSGWLWLRVFFLVTSSGTPTYISSGRPAGWVNAVTLVLYLLQFAWAVINYCADSDTALLC